MTERSEATNPKRLIGMVALGVLSVAFILWVGREKDSPRIRQQPRLDAGRRGTVGK